MSDIPTLSQVEEITAGANSVIRNLQITQCYHELSLALAERTGQSANWCTFATWASKQAGQTIRKEDLARTLEECWARMRQQTRQPRAWQLRREGLSAIQYPRDPGIYLESLEPFFGFRPFK